MSISIPQVNTAAGGDTFTLLFQRFNQVANALSTVVITTAANTVGAPTTGNSQVAGIFSSTVLATPNLRGGTVANAADLVISSNVNINAGSIWVGNSTVNTSVNSTAIVVNNAIIQNLTVASLTLGASISIGGYVDGYFTVTTTNTSNQVIDSYPIATYRSSEYTIQVRDSNNNIQMSKLLVVADGVDAFMTEYGIITSNSTLGVWSSSANATHAILSFLPVAANNVIKLVRKVIST